MIGPHCFAAFNPSQDQFLHSSHHGHRYRVVVVRHCAVAVVFTGIVHAFTAALGQAGQFLALILMVLQLVSAGGTFPWQTIPVSLRWLHHVLPMSYAVDGLRQIMYGAPSPRLLTDVLVLVAWGIVALAVSIAVGARRGGTAAIDASMPVELARV